MGSLYTMHCAPKKRSTDLNWCSERSSRSVTYSASIAIRPSWTSTIAWTFPSPPPRSPTRIRGRRWGRPGEYRTLWQVRFHYVPMQGQRQYACGEGGSVTVPRPAEVLHVREPWGKGEVPDGAPARGIRGGGKDGGSIGVKDWLTVKKRGDDDVV